MALSRVRRMLRVVQRGKRKGKKNEWGGVEGLQGQAESEVGKEQARTTWHGRLRRATAIRSQKGVGLCTTHAPSLHSLQERLYDQLRGAVACREGGESKRGEAERRSNGGVRLVNDVRHLLSLSLSLSVRAVLSLLSSPAIADACAAALHANRIRGLHERQAPEPPGRTRFVLETVPCTQCFAVFCPDNLRRIHCCFTYASTYGGW